MIVRAAGKEDRAWIRRLIGERWGAETVVTRGRIHRPDELAGLVAEARGERSGLLTWRGEGSAWEIVTLDALHPGRGTGTTLVEHLLGLARPAGVERVWLVTTNDNLPAQRFYERRGFTLVRVHRGALEASRALKPEIPLVGIGGIPLTDELEYERLLQEKQGRRPR